MLTEFKLLTEIASTLTSLFFKNKEGHDLERKELSTFLRNTAIKLRLYGEAIQALQYQGFSPEKYREAVELKSYLESNIYPMLQYGDEEVDELRRIAMQAGNRLRYVKVTDGELVPDFAKLYNAAIHKWDNDEKFKTVMDIFKAAGEFEAKADQLQNLPTMK